MEFFWAQSRKQSLLINNYYRRLGEGSVGMEPGMEDYVLARAHERRMYTGR